ncbi:nuclear transport factor 2 family protein [Altericroceibacterium endophyticum]|uniref:DUF4440 domain-containing protein n=1 Tax=Altericroceibacterium endophyticum TaxID=1808508 RepID=A0A6I4T9B4_9SPHN|nr:nuclear transport factor 2 family protein [Altericroceibacterium endophyticum]MXO66593.1 DUF4440 domain-containing protein [Altericroceibacterium endophyticum]
MTERGDLRDWFETYLAAFNRGDSEEFGAYYADQVVFQGQAAQVVGRDAVIRFYDEVRQYLEERVELLSFVGAGDGQHIFAELRTNLRAVKDWPDMPTGAMAAGDERWSVNFALYDIEDQRFTRVRTARVASSKRASS